MRTRDRLAAELRKVAAIAGPDNAPKYEAFAKRAETGEFDDYADTYVCPITQLYAELKAAGLTKFAARVADGEFDATKEEIRTGKQDNGPVARASRWHRRRSRYRPDCGVSFLTSASVLRP